MTVILLYFSHVGVDVAGKFKDAVDANYFLLIVKIGKNTMGDQTENLKKLLKEYTDVFAFSTQEMPGIPRELAEHKLRISPSIKPVK